MILLWNRSRAQSNALQKFFNVLCTRIGYERTLIAHQRWPWNVVDICVPGCPTRQFLHTVLHELGHVKDYVFDPDRSFLM